VMILFIIAAAGVFSYMLSSLFITQSIAEWIGTLDVNRWVLMGAVNVFLLIAGFFLPPVAVILMAAPILLPIITTAGFDPIWFAVVLTINMEIGLISPAGGPEPLRHQRHRAGHQAQDDPHGAPCPSWPAW
jgi:C4-dicarboxylate transporter DctM subunit